MNLKIYLKEFILQKIKYIKFLRNFVIYYRFIDNKNLTMLNDWRTIYEYLKKNKFLLFTYFHWRKLFVKRRSLSFRFNRNTLLVLPNLCRYLVTSMASTYSVIKFDKPSIHPSRWTTYKSFLAGTVHWLRCLYI